MGWKSRNVIQKDEKYLEGIQIISSQLFFKYVIKIYIAELPMLVRIELAMNQERGVSLVFKK